MDRTAELELNEYCRDLLALCIKCKKCDFEDKPETSASFDTFRNDLINQVFNVAMYQDRLKFNSKYSSAVSSLSYLIDIIKSAKTFGEMRKLIRDSNNDAFSTLFNHLRLFMSGMQGKVHNKLQEGYKLEKTFYIMYRRDEYMERDIPKPAPREQLIGRESSQLVKEKVNDQTIDEMRKILVTFGRQIDDMCVVLDAVHEKVDKTEDNVKDTLDLISGEQKKSWFKRLFHLK